MRQHQTSTSGWDVPQAISRSLYAVVAIGFLVVLTWFSSATPATATGVYSLPKLSAGEPNWVIDDGAVLSRLTRSEISSELEALAQQTGKEVRLVTIHRLDYGETAESFAKQLFAKWFPTADEQDNQAIVVLDTVTNSAAIEAGEGVRETLLPETIASIAQETIMVPLREGNKYNQSLLDASDRLLAVISGQPDPGPPVVESAVQTEGTFARAEETDDKNATVVVVVLLLAATIIPMATYYLYQVIQS